MLYHLRAAGVSVLVDARGAGVPAILHWGRDLGELDANALTAVADAAVPAIAPSSIDMPLRLSLLPSLTEGWTGRPAFLFARDRPLELALHVVGIDHSGDELGIRLADSTAAVEVVLDLRLSTEGVLRIRSLVRNVGAEVLRVGGVAAVAPVPDRARQILDFTGLWAGERVPQHLLPGMGTWSRESRHGRPGHDSPFLLAAGTPGFDFRTGEVWAAHLAWSGDAQHWYERSPLGPTVIGVGELLAPGEVDLRSNEVHTSPWSVLVFSDAGLDGISDRLHRWVRSRRAPLAERPVVLNTWEAVYFDQSLPRLQPLIDAAAQVGVERFVLDDGWFRGRSDDRRALGDWFVDEDRWPHGLAPLIESVTRAGMDFGLWVEPEMINGDSEAARAHPEWLLQTPPSPTWRWQNTIDLADADAFDYVFERMHALLSEYPIRYLKWDHNRDLLRSDAHRQTAAFYRLLDAVRSAHPDVEIESCASGGARIDLGVLERVERVWASDSNDPLVRQRVQRYTTLVVPPEYVGSHLGAARAHTSGRTSPLAFRMITALFGSAGIEWNLAEAGPEERASITSWIALYKRERALLHSGTVVRGDLADPSLLLHGVVDTEARRGLYAFVALDSTASAAPPPVRLPGLAPERSYRVRRVEIGEPSLPIADAAPPWWVAGETVLPGSVLGELGLPMPLLPPQSAILIEVVAVDTE
ncbi:alpha-galactosidase [Rathayibacter sp. YIM 133350]|uniref:alpha-galactosidase n=1 Tax=Rathayibacter sp. YIM 133350 TaxID=3131992 RepID=UPI00307F91EC